ncbi:MAG: hypothetical protein AAGG75_12290 [Bacteroidota bacterium]
MKTLMAISLLLIGMLTTGFNTHEKEPQPEVTTTIAKFTATANCCGTVTVGQPFCTGDPRPAYIISIRRVDRSVAAPLNPGNNAVAVDAGRDYVIEFTSNVNNTNCVDLPVSWNLCNNSGSGVLTLGGSGVPASAGKIPSQIPCFGF